MSNKHIAALFFALWPLKKHRLSSTCFKDRADHRNNKLTMAFLLLPLLLLCLHCFFCVPFSHSMLLSVLGHFPFFISIPQTSQNITRMCCTLHPFLFGLHPPNFFYSLIFGKFFCMGSLLRKPFQFKPPNIFTTYPRLDVSVARRIKSFLLLYQRNQQAG